jgi:hypothetical protein
VPTSTIGIQPHPETVSNLSTIDFGHHLEYDAEVGIEDEKMRRRRKRLKTMEGDRNFG